MSGWTENHMVLVNLKPKVCPMHFLQYHWLLSRIVLCQPDYTFETVFWSVMDDPCRDVRVWMVQGESEWWSSLTLKQIKTLFHEMLLLWCLEVWMGKHPHLSKKPLSNYNSTVWSSTKYHELIIFNDRVQILRITGCRYSPILIGSVISLVKRSACHDVLNNGFQTLHFCKTK